MWAAFGVAGRRRRALDAGDPGRVPAGSGPTEFLTHPVFHEHRSETAMLRYLRRLADDDLALDRTMIPLGSCTMKLNAAAEMEPITLARASRTCTRSRRPSRRAGYLELIARPGALAGRDHRLRRGVAAAQRRLARASSPGCWRSAAYHRPRRRAAATSA